MRISGLLLCCVLVAGCSRGAASLPATQSASARQLPLTSSGYHSLYAFKGAPDGADPAAGLVNVNGKLYGTTVQGGAGTCGQHGCGVLFEMTREGSEDVTYSFAGGTDGQNPMAALIAVNGRIYGTTQGGGSSSGGGGGTVYEWPRFGGERVLHRFTGTPDGADPYAGLLFYEGLFYGTTYSGGKDGNGAVFTVNRASKERVLYSFKGGADGSAPLGGLTVVHGILYGTTAGGGRGTAGTVYSLTTRGKERVIYSFKGGSDGETPATTLVDARGELYGTTVYGGTASQSNGTVFAVSRSGVERVVYRFQGGSDGATPYGNLVAINGTLYGTTYFGGSGSPSGHGNGTLYEVTKAGAEVQLHQFQGGSDGANPAAGLLYANHVLYGTTSEAGLSVPSGNGTVFSFSP